MLVEKPFAEKMSDAVSFVEAAEKAGVVLAVNQQLRFMPDILKAREMIDSTGLGEIRFIAHDHFQNRTRTRGWRKDEERLEISIFSIHVLDRVRWLMGRPPEAVAAVTRYWDENVRGETFTSLTVQFKGGPIGTMVSNWHSMTMPVCRLRVDGTKGSLVSVKERIHADQCTLTVHPLEGEAKRYDCSRQNNFTMAMGESMKRLVQAASTGTQPVHSGRDNLETMAIVDGAYLSASRGGEIIDISKIWQR
jgi:predicted dehydrogenase